MKFSSQKLLCQAYLQMNLLPAIKKYFQWGMAVHACNPGTQESEAGGLS